MSLAIMAIWWVMLIVTILVVVPVVVLLLTRALNAARHIERYTEEILASGGGIAENTANVVALKETIATAGQLLAGAESIERHAATIEGVLASQPSGNGRIRKSEVNP